jgi:hypothetical protein
LKITISAYGYSALSKPPVFFIIINSIPPSMIPSSRNILRIQTCSGSQLIEIRKEYFFISITIINLQCWSIWINISSIPSKSLRKGIA